MAIQLLLGDSGVGKTHYIYSQIINKSIKEPHKNFVMIVPEQFTMKTQQDIIEMHKNKGILNIEVLSFGRLAYRIYDDLMVAEKAMLNESGKGMIIRKILEEQSGEYKILSKNISRNGYIHEILDMLKEFYQYDLNKDGFSTIYEHVKSPLLVDKMKDLETLFHAFNSFVSEDYITTESTMDLLARSLGTAEFLKNSEVYIDGFYGFTPIQYRIITELIKYALDVTLAVTIDEENIYNTEEQNLFNESKKILHSIRQLTEKYQLEQKKTIIYNNESYRYTAQKSLLHIQNQLFRFKNSDKIKGSAVYLSEVKNMVEEVQYVADSIHKLVRHQGYRYKDIAILTGDLISYEKIISRQFDAYNIPCFIDSVKGITKHPFVELINNVLDMLIYGYNYESVIRFLRNGILELDDEVLDQLENYAICYGTRGKKQWEAPFEQLYPYLKYEENSILNERVIENINLLKSDIFHKVDQAFNACKGNQSVRVYVEALYNFCEAINSYEHINRMEKSFETAGDLEKSLEYSQIYKQVMDLLNQLVEILGDTQVNLKGFKQLLESGFDYGELKIIPPSFDQVAVGDIERSRLKEVKALFVIGCNENKIPKSGDKTGIITDAERIKLQKIGVDLAPDNKTNLFKEQFSIYMAMLNCTDKLYISYAKTSNDGSTLLPSMLFYDIKNMFIEMKVHSIERLYQSKTIINEPKPTLGRIVNRVARRQTLDQEQLQALEWLQNNEGYQSQVNRALKGLRNDNKAILDNTELITKIYGKELSSSVSRLELFAKCPFAHFAEYGLDLNERLQYEIRSDHMGIMLHQAIAMFFDIINVRQITLEEVNPNRDDGYNKIVTLVDEIIYTIVEQDKTGVFKSTNRRKYIVSRLRKIVIRGIKTVLYQVSKGDFKPKAFEFSFNGNDQDSKDLKLTFDNGQQMNIKGQIDRIDEFESEDALYLSVVDYKSGNKNIDLNAVYYGLQLQLLLYLNAAKKLKDDETDKEVVPAGAFYFYMNNPIIKDVGKRDIEAIEKSILQELRLKGIVLSEDHVIAHFDRDLLNKSDVIPVTLKKDGSLSAASSAVTKDKFDLLQSYVKYKTKDIGQEIVSGNINIYPYKYKEQKGCDYCEYHDICRFEQGALEYNEFEKLSKEKIWEKMTEELDR